MKPWLVLVNPCAGRRRNAKTRVEAALRSRNIPADILVMDGSDTLRKTVGQAAAEGRDRFAAVGGDGTVNAVLNAVLAHPWDAAPVLAVLPAGAGCDLLRTFGIGAEAEDAIEYASDRLLGDDVYPVDVGLAVGEWGRRYFINAADAGSTAAAALRLPVWWGPFRYTGAAAALIGFGGGEIRLDAGGRIFEGKALAVIFANGQFFGAGFNIAPRASMMDRLLDIQVITASRRQLGQLLAKARGGHHLSDPNVHRYTAAEARVETREPWPVRADGEPLGAAPLLVRVQAGRIALKV